MTETAVKGPVFYSEEAITKLEVYLKENQPSRTFILVDTNTHKHCLSAFLSRITIPEPIEIIEIAEGESHKNLETCSQVWEVLSELGGDRKSLMINLGGGVVTDLGGFVASCFKRGIPYINVPTSLLAMVDASVGGKTGVDLGNLKNQIGVINQAEMVMLDPGFLATLPKNEMRSGLAEILKHGLISDEHYWEKVSSLADLNVEDLEDIIRESVDIKTEVVLKDPTEKHLRKTLNFGHTLGHAIESYFLTEPGKKRLLHGEAVAVGMILATFLSMELQGFPVEKARKVTEKILEVYGKVPFEPKDIEAVIDLMKYDKKNEFGKIYFVLLKDIGVPVTNCLVPNEMIYKAFDFYAKA